MSPVDASVWVDGRLQSYAPAGSGTYGNIPTELLDWTQNVHDLNDGRPDLHDLRWRAAEFRAEVGGPDPTVASSWEEPRRRLIEEIRTAFPNIQLPTEDAAKTLLVVLDWVRSDTARRAISDRLNGWERAFSFEVLSRADEDWTDHVHAIVLDYLRDNAPDTDRLVRAALPGCREVVLKWNSHNEPMATVGLSPETLCLEYREFAFDKKARETYLSSVSEVVPSRFVVRRVVDEAGRDWYEWPKDRESESGPVVLRASREELIDSVRGAYRPMGAMLRALGAWLERLPVTGEVRTRLALVGPKDRRTGLTVGWSVPPVFGKSVDGRTNAAGILAGWYRPRDRATAKRRLAELLSYLATDKLRLVACYVAGAPVFRRLAPSRPLPYLELVGESGAGKTFTTQAAISVLWALGDGDHEYVSGDMIHSAFRRSDLFSATDLPVLVDETQISRPERESMRAVANGSTTSRGGTDLLHRTYAPTSPIIFTRNGSPDDSESSSSERHGDDRRRIRLLFDEEDASAVSSTGGSFGAWMRGLVLDPVAELGPDGTGLVGGAALFAVNDLTNGGVNLSGFAGLANSEIPEKEAVVRIGAQLLGIDPPTMPGPADDHAAETFFDWLRVESARWVEIRYASDDSGNRGARVARSDPTLQRIRPETAVGDVPSVAEDIHHVYVTTAALEEYRAYRRRMGLASPYVRLSDLASLATETGQTASDVVGKPDPARSGASRGHVVRVSGVLVRAAKIVLPRPRVEALPDAQRTLEGVPESPV